MKKIRKNIYKLFFLQQMLVQTIFLWVFGDYVALKKILLSSVNEYLVYELLLVLEIALRFFSYKRSLENGFVRKN